MITFGIHDGHMATACLIKNGQILACISEERLDRKKGWCGFPEKAIRKCLEITGIDPREVDGVGIAGRIPPIKNYEGFNKPQGLRRVYSFGNYLVPKNILRSSLWVQPAVSILSRFRNYKEIYKKLQSIGMMREPVFYDHHELHALSAYSCSPFYESEEKTLVLTCDGSGDAVSATVNIGKGRKLDRIQTISNYNSLGEFYTRITQYLGMKPLFDEYKVMGLAAYTSKQYSESAYNKINNFIKINKNSLCFENHSGQYKWQYLKKLYKLLKDERFDSIAYAAQKLLERILKEWVTDCIEKTGIRRIVVSGGVFMNVKANYEILNLPEVESLWILPSCGDESLAIGAAMKCSKELGFDKFEPLKEIYFGPKYSNDEIKGIIEKYKDVFVIKEMNNIDHYLGKELAKGKIVGRFTGRMEWGARALGNRSILTDPRDQKIIMKINKSIKGRDFWMPFAPSILEERSDNYFKTIKNFKSPYMIMAFPSLEKAHGEIPAAIHPYDLSVRPQIVQKSWNPKYYKVLKSFEEETGIGGILNTSFNLSGFPIVCSPSDAINVFLKSGLDSLALEDFYLVKRSNNKQ